MLLGLAAVLGYVLVILVVVRVRASWNLYLDQTFSYCECPWMGTSCVWRFGEGWVCWLFQFLIVHLNVSVV